jgi:predicted RNA-binding Zn-ribbon protein involved in translation (DUF1610 family)
MSFPQYAEKRSFPTLLNALPALPSPIAPNTKTCVTTDLTIEPGKEVVAGHCDCCGQQTRIFRGLITRDSNAYAVYVASYTANHPELGVSIAIATGGWGADAAPRNCIVLDWRMSESGPACRIMDAASSRWAREATLGRMLSRSEARDQELFAETFRISDEIFNNDQRLSDALKPRRNID